MLRGSIRRFRLRKEVHVKMRSDLRKGSCREVRKYSFLNALDDFVTYTKHALELERPCLRTKAGNDEWPVPCPSQFLGVSPWVVVVAAGFIGVVTGYVFAPKHLVCS